MKFLETQQAKKEYFSVCCTADITEQNFGLSRFLFFSFYLYHLLLMYIVHVLLVFVNVDKKCLSGGFWHVHVYIKNLWGFKYGVFHAYRWMSSKLLIFGAIEFVYIFLFLFILGLVVDKFSDNSNQWVMCIKASPVCYLNDNTLWIFSANAFLSVCRTGNT